MNYNPFNMKIRIILSAIALFTFLGLSAQHPREEGERRERIKAFKIAYITEKMALTPAEAQVFWPVFNEFEAKRQDLELELTGQVMDKRPDIENMSDAEVDKFISSRLDKEKELANLRIEYYGYLKELLPVKKVFRLIEAEAGFKKVLLERLQGEPPPRRPGP